MNALEILLDATSRPLEAMADFRGCLTPETLNQHPGGHPNSIAWLLWHSGREIDVQLTHLSCREEVWTSDGFRDRFALGAVGDGVGYGHSDDEARAIVVDDGGLLVEYVTATVEALQDYIRSLDEAALDDVVDRHWTPHVTRGVRLVSIIDDATQHIAQAAYVCGMPFPGR
ncbi:mycothiol transferase [Tessaracoccus sp. Z1128]